MTRLALLAFAVLGACGGDSTNTPTPDAPKAADAAPPTVLAVTCPATPAATITTSDATLAYSPASATITQGQVVKFAMSSLHDVEPDAGGDPGLTVGFNEMKCLMFTHPGTFKFHCGPHNFMGTVIVQ